MKVHYEHKTYADNRFMEKGVELQMNSNSYWEAKRNYEYSCMLCCTRNVGACECAHCPIREAMLTNAEKIFWKKIPKQEYEWIRKERELR